MRVFCMVVGHYCIEVKVMSDQIVFTMHYVINILGFLNWTKHLGLSTSCLGIVEEPIAPTKMLKNLKHIQNNKFET